MTIARISVNSAGQQVSGDSGSASISSDGRYITFRSNADTLASPDSNAGTFDIFLHDRQTGSTNLVVSGANSASFEPSISANGSSIVFHSFATNIANGDLNGSNSDIFFYDVTTGLLTNITGYGDRESLNASISDDGRFVSFESSASNLVANDSNGSTRDIFVFDRLNGTMSLLTGGANSLSEFPSISGDGRYVAFDSYANNLASGDTNGTTPDIFIYDRQSASTTLITPGSNGFSFWPVLSGDGRYVAFSSTASNLVSADSNNELVDVFLHDRIAETTTLISDGGDGLSSRPSISSDGRFITFESTATNLVSGDTNGHRDIFVYDALTDNTAIVTAAANGPSFDAKISNDGRFIVFNSTSSNLVDGDTNGASDIFVATNPLFPNTSPQGTDSTVTTNEDTPYTFSVADFGFTDPDAGDELATVRIDTLPATGQLRIDADGAGPSPPVLVTAGQIIAAADIGLLTYTPPENANGTGYATITFSVSDGTDFDATPNTLTIDVTPVNDDPTANADTFTVGEDAAAAVIGNALANDTDPDAGDTLTALVQTNVDGSNGGLFSIAANGDVTFNPRQDFQSLNAGQTATTSFTYTAEDGNGGTDTATITVTVEGANDITAINDHFTVDENAAAAIVGNALANDIEPDAGDTLSAIPQSHVAGTSGGHFSIAANGDITFDPGQDFQLLGHGQSADTLFIYTAEDGNNGSATASVTVTVHGVNDNPSAFDSEFVAGEDDPATIVGNALESDFDIDGDTLTALVQTNVAGSNGGLFSIAANGDVTFNPGQDFQTLNASQTATTSFTYTAEDGNGGSDTATVTVLVEGANGATVVVRTEDTRVGGTGTLTRYYGDSESGVESGRILSFTYASGILAARELVYEDGRTLSATYDANGKIAHQTLTDGPGGTLSYQSSTTTYVDGVRSQVATLSDNGTTSITDYAANGTTRTQTTVIDSTVDGGIHNFETLTTSYHANGKIAGRVTEFDEGERYARTEFFYDEDGDPESQLFVFPEGNSRENIFASGVLDRIVDTDIAGLKTVWGLAGDDVLTGGGANDRLFGGNDNDTLNGGEGDDLLVGQAGDDVFVFTGIVGNDTITDFDDAGNDMLDLLAFGIASRDDLDLAGAIAQSGTAVVIDLAAIDEAYEGTITLTKTTLASITNDDFATIV